MGYHTFDVDNADKLEEAAWRYRFLSAEELLGALALSSNHAAADLGSGTGFYTDDVAPHASEVYAVDIQEAMHEYYREKGVPANVELVTTGIEDLPFEDGSLDAAFSTMTYHEFASDDAFAAIHRVLGPTGRLVIVDWTATGTGENGPPLDERYTADAAADSLRDHGFAIEHEISRPETFLLVATIE
ncbi:class I SAM-dependent methyltransferase [Halococcus saccharolyticus]|uniref:Methyltransferase type 11 n=1 Tax=Halococcus saccharolyticus DSM 5350 TaxID=1227455 RepID=M0ML94_9EURY|nr:class I SAM-dependent methyltransferase [Halococcus saccharolyticus]EMA45220.1 methyltransferase type 11 [Halococcus saccharolyticus DSM 5350]